MTTYAVEAVHSDQGTIVVFEGWLFNREDTTTYLVAVDHRMAQAIVDDLGDGEPVIVEAEDWQIVGSVR